MHMLQWIQGCMMPTFMRNLQNVTSFQIQTFLLGLRAVIRKNEKLAR